MKIINWLISMSYNYNFAACLVFPHYRPHQKEEHGNCSSKTIIYTRKTKTIPGTFTERHSLKGDQITGAELINTVIEQPESLCLADMCSFISPISSRARICEVNKFDESINLL